MTDASDEDIGKLLGPVTEAAKTVSARLVTLLTVGGYIAVIVASTTDEMLVRRSPVTLPLLNVNIPISGLFGFYMVAPWLILALHFDLLVQLSVLGRKLARFNETLAGLKDEQRERLRDGMSTYHYVQFLSGETCGGFRPVLHGLAFFASMIALPLTLLCFMQLRSLPLREPQVSWSQGLALSIEVVVILMLLWPLIPVRSLRAVMALACVSVWGFYMVASYLEAQSAVPSTWYRSTLDLQGKDLTGDKDTLSPQTINALRDGDVAERTKQLANIAQSHLLQGHDLRGAKLYTAVLPKLDLRTLKLDTGEWTHTRLRKADLSWAQMQQAQFDDTDIRGAKLQGAELQGASMPRVNLQDGDLDQAKLQEANLSNAQLARAKLPNAKLQGANLENARLFYAELPRANLQGANLRGASLKMADLSETSLEGADLSGANLAGARLRGAKLEGSILRGAVIDKADFDGTNLHPLDNGAAIDHPPDDHGAVPRVCFRQCCLREVEPSGLRCEGVRTEERRPDEVHHPSRADHLMGLACRDAYAARGLSAQALRAGDDSERPGLAQALVKKRERNDCLGVQLLPEGTLEELRRRAAQ